MDETRKLSVILKIKLSKRSDAKSEGVMEVQEASFRGNLPWITGWKVITIEANAHQEVHNWLKQIVGSFKKWIL